MVMSHQRAADDVVMVAAAAAVVVTMVADVADEGTVAERSE